ncbi:sigma-70 family RNA polymerase sigma factor [Pseudorhodoferax sp.]|uniref:sigma-70 family RNA polymerase sigma factor n=1 Tax=Pseudorhodoferax sp. TaxID=1993553 RepID=UPI002DD69E89|nr:sigma-70 family RNA polymerase sigma factor [Pseudorhodoferax sp.]
MIHALYSEHHNWLHGWLRRKLGDAHHAADLAQDTFVRILAACRAQELVLHELREPRAYLTTVAGRVLVNHYRRASLEQAWLAALATQPQPFAASPEERLSILQTLNEIDALLDALPPRTRTVFLLSQLEGLTYAQIAERMDVAPRTVKRHMAQAFEECLMQVA